LKIVYHGPKAMEELVAYDPHLVVGILGGGAGTTYDAFKLIAEAQKYGARAALFGRKINQAECQLAFVQFLRLIVEHQITPEEAVRAYHGVLERLKIKPLRSLADDLTLQTGVMSYGGGSTVTVPAAVGGQRKVGGKDTSAVGKGHVCPCGGPSPSQCACKHEPAPAPTVAAAPSLAQNGRPDFSKMTQAEKLAWNKAERDRVYGK
jgi:hypothetical protein